ncbi:MAG: hypothetical protein HC855_04745 [Rhizobiales bacterium]|nr:hypothetical protein [Hyphomicrobiales bacterium]
MITDEVSLEPLIIPETNDFDSDAELTKVAYRNTSYFGGLASGLAWHQQDYISDFVFWTVSNPDDKLRSNLRIGIGDIFSRFQAAEVSSSESFFDKKIQPNEDISYYDVFNRKLMTFRQRRVDTNDDLKTYSYESILSRLNDTYPPSYVMRADDLPGDPTQQTAGQWVQHLFEEWATNYNWFDYEPIPELYPRILNGGTYSYTIRSKAFAIVQEEDQEKSMRQIIDEVLGIFEGYRLVVTKDNKLKIVPPVWSAAYSSGQVVLTDHDLYTYPIALPQDYSNIINKVTVRSQAYAYDADEPIIAPSFVKSENSSFAPNNLADFYPSRAEYDTVAEIPITSPVIGGDKITLQLSLEYYWEDLKETHTNTLQLTRGKDVLLKRNSVFSTGFLCDAEIETSWRFRWDDVKNVIEVERYYMYYRPPGGICGQSEKYGVLLMVDATGQSWQKSNATIIRKFWNVLKILMN